MKQDKVYLNQVGVFCAAGRDLKTLKQHFLDADTREFMTWSDAFGSESLPLGMCTANLPDIPLEDNEWQSRNNQFAFFVFEQIRETVAEAIKRYGAERVGVVIGTSTSGIGDAEAPIKAYARQQPVPKSYHYGIQEMGNTAEFIATIAGVKGPVYGISTACSSGAKALISGKRLITSGLCDVVIAGGVDTLCKLTVQGFSSLEAVSKQVCRPFSRHRDGINIGEAGALFVMSREPQGVCLAGAGESSDAHHISAPQPEGKGAEQCMRMALLDAGLDAEHIDYINLHGTATVLNDQMESLAVSRVFPPEVLCSSTKPMTGHTLGAAGALEAAICWLALTETDFIPLHLWDGEADTSLPALNFVESSKVDQPVLRALSNSFAFGGNNVSLILERI